MMQFLDKWGYPVEIIRGHPFQNIIRRIIHTRIVENNYIKMPAAMLWFLLAIVILVIAEKL